MVATHTNMTRTLMGASASDKGRRKQNEDSVRFELTDDGAFAIVADGMGGGLDGKRFSERAVDVLGERLRAAPARDHSGLARGIAQVAREINGLRKSNPDYHVSGTTLVAAVFQQYEQHTDAMIANIGDSRAYKIPASGPAEQLTHDHIYAEHLIQTGIDSIEAYEHTQALRLTHALGDALNLDQVPHLYTPEPVRLAPGEFIVLCTDGICKHLGPAQIAEIARSQPPEQAVNELVRAATAAGSKDNVSAVIVGYTYVKPKPSLILPIVGVIALLLIGLGGLSLWYGSAGAQSPGGLPEVAATVTSIPTVATPLPPTSTPAVVGPQTSTPAPSVTLTPTHTPTNTPTPTNTSLPTNTPTRPAANTATPPAVTTPQVTPTIDGSDDITPGDPSTPAESTPTNTVTPTQAPTEPGEGDPSNQPSAEPTNGSPPAATGTSNGAQPTEAPPPAVPTQPDPAIPPPAPPTPTFTPVPDGNLDVPTP